MFIKPIMYKYSKDGMKWYSFVKYLSLLSAFYYGFYVMVSLGTSLLLVAIFAIIAVLNIMTFVGLSQMKYWGVICYYISVLIPAISEVVNVINGVPGYNIGSAGGRLVFFILIFVYFEHRRPLFSPYDNNQEFNTSDEVYKEANQMDDVAKPITLSTSSSSVNESTNKIFESNSSDTRLLVDTPDGRSIWVTESDLIRMKTMTEEADANRERILKGLMEAMNPQKVNSINEPEKESVNDEPSVKTINDNMEYDTLPIINYCFNCGYKLVPNSKFCSKCGSKLRV